MEILLKIVRAMSWPMRNIILTLAAFNDELLDQKDLQMWGENLLKKDLKKKEKRHALDHKKKKENTLSH